MERPFAEYYFIVHKIKADEHMYRFTFGMRQSAIQCSAAICCCVLQHDKIKVAGLVAKHAAVEIDLSKPVSVKNGLNVLNDSIRQVVCVSEAVFLTTLLYEFDQWVRVEWRFFNYKEYFIYLFFDVYWYCYGK
jgi:hypothetical protein